MPNAKLLKDVILFDFGDTLVGYRTQSGFAPLLRAGIERAREIFERLGLVTTPPKAIDARVEAENYEADDWTVRPIEGRFGRIFGLEPGAASPETMAAASQAFLAPLLATAELYAETIPTLEALRRRGHRLGIVSNMPWGSPVAPWVEELSRHDITRHMEHVVFCHDTAKRKPHRAIFDHALRLFSCEPGNALFVGDRPDWDIAGAEEAGMSAVLIDRENRWPDFQGARISRLAELLDVVGG